MTLALPKEEHARLGASKASRWIRCPGSVAPGWPAVSTSSRYADEGTCAHLLAAHRLRKLVETEELEASLTPFLLSGSYADLSRFVNIYVENVRQYAKDALLEVEYRLDLSGIVGERCWGTADAIVLCPDGELQVHDLKYGMGVPVEAVENEQLALYALAAYDLYRGFATISRIRLVIHQPRLTTAPKEWDVPIEEFLRRYSDVFGDAAEKTRAPDAIRNLSPGEKQCHFCPHKANCPALGAAVSRAVVGADEFSAVSLPRKEEVAVRIKAEHDPEKLANLYRAVPLVELWLNAVKEAVSDALIRGERVPGYKLVAGRQGNRAWTSPAVVEQILKNMRFAKDEMFKRTLISPTEAEKLLAEYPTRWNRLKGFITRGAGKPVVASESDPRPAFTPTEDEFDSLSPSNQ